ncbi:uncharacterized protein [Neodiprion pinetum]|uniref:uncharacterized protein n=1 Tax=Neodiprion pinetum TaxID=441929 RepID=UPI00371077F8
MQSSEISKQKDVPHQIAPASAAIRRKHRLLKSGKESTTQKLSDVCKPVVTPLEELVNVTKDTEPVKQEVEEIKEEIKQMKNETKNKTVSEMVDSFASTGDGTIVETPVEKIEGEYFALMRDAKTKCKSDNVYGVRTLSNGLMIGDSLISSESDYIRIGDTLHPKTKGLSELLFKKKPDGSSVSAENWENFTNIILATNAHKKYHSSYGAVRNANSYKFKNVNAELTDYPLSLRRNGKGLLPQAMITRQGVETEYVFWDNPNKLAERLRLLLASQAAGNPSHNNGIISIIEELREAGIIC